MKPAGSIRRALRIILILIFCLLMYAAGLLIKLVTLRAPRLRLRWVFAATRFWGYGMARIIGMRIRVEGMRPRAPFFLVSNHLSYVDIFLLCAVSPAWFISKSEVAGWPAIGALTRLGPTIYIDREVRRDVKRMNRLIADLVLAGGAVGFFPEGTTTDGESLLPFKPSLFQPAVEMNLPVTLAAIAYETPPGLPPPRELIAWHGDEAFAPHISRLLTRPGFRAVIRFGEETLTAPDRKQLSQEAHRCIAAMLADMKAGKLE